MVAQMTASSKYRSAYTRFIPREELGHATPVQFGAVDGSGLKIFSAEDKLATEQALQEEQLREQKKKNAKKTQQML